MKMLNLYLISSIHRNRLREILPSRTTRGYATPLNKNRIGYYIGKRPFLWNEFIPDTSSITKKPNIGVFSKTPFTMNINFDIIEAIPLWYNIPHVELENELLYKEISKFIYWTIPGKEYTSYIRVLGEEHLGQIYKVAFLYENICDKQVLVLQLRSFMIDVFRRYSKKPYPVSAGVGSRGVFMRKSYNPTFNPFKEGPHQTNINFNKLQLIVVPTINMYFMESEACIDDRDYYVDLPNNNPSYFPIHEVEFIKEGKIDNHFVEEHISYAYPAITLGWDHLICINVDDAYYSKHFILIDDSEQDMEYLSRDIIGKVNNFIKTVRNGTPIKIIMYTSAKL